MQKITVEDFQARAGEMRALAAAAASAIAPADLSDEGLARWKEALVSAINVLDEAAREAAAVLSTRTISGVLRKVENPVVSDGGKQLDLARITLTPDIGKFPETPWIDLRSPSGIELAKTAEELAGKRVICRIRQVVSLQDGKPESEGGVCSSRSRLVEIEAE